MNRLAERSANYLRDLGLPIGEPKPFRARSLSYHLSDNFELVECAIDGRPAVLAIDLKAPRSPAETEKLMRRLGDHIDLPLVYVTESLSSFDRRRLIERRVSFLVPGNQLYWPTAGMDLREHFRKHVAPRVLSPASQALLLTLLQSPMAGAAHSAGEVASSLDYSAMTASRAARELAAVELAATEKSTGGQHISLIHSPRKTWELALPLLRSPVKRVVHARLWDFTPPPSDAGMLVTAGLTELARRTMLAEHGPEVVACTQDTWKAVKRWVKELPRADEGASEIQIWHYSPTLGETDRLLARVDPLSLYLSLRESDDPRVEQALDELLEQVWP